MVYNLLLLFFREFSVHLSDEGLNTSMISARVQDRIWLDCPTNRVRINIKFVLSRLHELQIKNAFMGIFLLCNLIYLMNYCNSCLFLRLHWSSHDINLKVCFSTFWIWMSYAIRVRDLFATLLFSILDPC